MDIVGYSKQGNDDDDDDGGGGGDDDAQMMDVDATPSDVEKSGEECDDSEEDPEGIRDLTGMRPSTFHKLARLLALRVPSLGARASQRDDHRAKTADLPVFDG